jgi:hypothetical protein
MRRTRIGTTIGVMLMAVALALNSGGCAANPGGGGGGGGNGQQQVDPNAMLDTISNLADIAEVSVTIFMDPGPEQAQLLQQIDKARQLSDLKALRDIIARFRGTPATQAAARAATRATIVQPVK